MYRKSLIGLSRQDDTPHYSEARPSRLPSRRTTAVKRAIFSFVLATLASLCFADGAISLSIRYYDKRVYYPDSDIAIKVSVTNGSPSTYRFKLAENRVYSMDFDVRTPANRQVDASDSFKRARSDSGPVFYRDVSIEPGEEYSFVESLSAYSSLKDPGTYAIQADFWPGLAPSTGAGGQAPLLSNVLMLSLRPTPPTAPTPLDSVKLETGEILRPEAIPPDEVVTRTIEARQRSRWNEFFLYLDLESLLRRSAELARSYDRQSDEGRRKMLDNFRADLQGKKGADSIVTLPKEFAIEETRYTANHGFVGVLEKFAEKGYTSVKEYSYELERRGDIWFIVGYSVVNKGTE